MADRFGSLSLQDGLVRYRHRAYTLEGVRATIDRSAEHQDRARSIAKLRPGRASNAPGSALLVEGPGFSWRIPVRARKLDAATDFADHLNDAARAYALHRSGRHLSGGHPDEIDSSGPESDQRPDAGDYGNRPDLIEHAFSSAEQLSRTAARGARLVR